MDGWMDGWMDGGEASNPKPQKADENVAVFIILVPWLL